MAHNIDQFRLKMIGKNGKLSVSIHVFKTHYVKSKRSFTTGQDLTGISSFK